MVNTNPVAASTAPAPMRPTRPHLCPKACRVLATQPRCCPRSRLGLPHRACPSSMGPSSPGLYPTVRPPDAAARFRRERRGQGRDPSQRAVPLTVGQGWVRGNKEGQGVVRVSIRHRPCSRRRRATTGHCARQRRSTSTRQAREARDRTIHRAHTAPPPRGHYRSTRIQVSTGPSLTARAGRTLHATKRSHPARHLKHAHAVALARQRRSQ